MTRFLLWGGFILTAAGIGSCGMGAISHMSTALDGQNTDQYLDMVFIGARMAAIGVLAVLTGALLNAVGFTEKDQGRQHETVSDVR